MTTSYTRKAMFRQLAGWTSGALIIGGLTACGGSSPAAIVTAPAVAPPSTTPVTAVEAPTSTSAAPRPSGARDERVVVSGGRLHIRCSGTGPTTVLLIAGWNDDSTSFSTIEPILAATTRVCSYDKFGTGTSDPVPEPQHFSTQAAELHELLQVTNETGPYVVVGHSFGGDVAVTFASEFPDDVRGLLLLDATPATWNSVLCAVPDDSTAATAGLVQVCAMQAAPSNNAEGIDGPSAFAELAGITSLGSLPLIVDTLADRGYAEQGVGPALAARLADAWKTGQDHWVSLSSQGELVDVADSGHYIHISQPSLVIEQIAALLA
ncbi:MAG TPA: alpha/beta hydrolase [Ilumatobacteraceae bacterium]|nr:alpha/beta hydrolase [Ilumatobacteraceae bacterium]